MNITVLGAAGFIGTNLILNLSKYSNNYILAYDQKMEYLKNLNDMNLNNVKCVQFTFDKQTDYNEILRGTDVVFHMISTTIPSDANNIVYDDFETNVLGTINLLNACVNMRVKKIIFISSGGTIYGLSKQFPYKENNSTEPICSYGLQKLTIEKLLYLYKYQSGLEYKIIRLSNPYGPYQRPNGKLGVITNFIYKAQRNETIHVFGDGSTIRDYIYIDDAINAIINIAFRNSSYDIFNVGSGQGKSLNDLLLIIKKLVNPNINVQYDEKRATDVPVNYLDVSRYKSIFGDILFTDIESGMLKTSVYLKNL